MDRDHNQGLAPVAERLWMYSVMVKSRRLEEQLLELYMSDKKPVFNIGAGVLSGEIHLSWGQEPVAAGVCAHLRPEDWITVAHRPHHIAVARGVDIKKIAAEILGRSTGLSGGRGGHMHLYDKESRFSSSGIVGEGLGPAAGMAFALKQRGQGGIGITFTGDGSVNQGAFHEVMNLVGLYNLPFVCVVEDNDYAVTTRKSASTAIQRNSDRAQAYNMAGEYVPGNDPDLIYRAAERAINRAREGRGGTILEIQTTRVHGHMVPDPQGYRPPEELAALADMIPTYRTRLLDDGITEEEVRASEDAARAEAEEAVAFALRSPVPDPSTAMTKVFA